MAHYAFLDENNVVVNVLTGLNEDQLIEGLDPETWYGNFHGLKCKRTSYNTHGGVHDLGGVPFRKNYGSVGYTYDEEKDAFIPPKRFNSWVLNNETCWWEAPIPYPLDGKTYAWSEDTVSWTEVS